MKTEFYRLPFGLARRLAGDGAAATWPSNSKLVEDGAGARVALFESDWSLRLAQEWNPSLHFEPFDATQQRAEAVR